MYPAIIFLISTSTKLHSVMCWQPGTFISWDTREEEEKGLYYTQYWKNTQRENKIFKINREKGPLEIKKTSDEFKQ